MLKVQIDYLLTVAHGLRRCRQRILTGEVKQENGRTGYVQGATVDGWKCIGTGHFSNVWSNPKFPGVVLKISGDGAYNDSLQFKLKGKDKKKEYANGRLRDMWPVWAQFCMDNQHIAGLPKVYALHKGRGSVVVAVVKSYQPYHMAPHVEYSDRMKTWAPIHYILQVMDNQFDWRDTVDVNMQRIKHDLQEENKPIWDRVRNEEWRAVRQLVELMIENRARMDYHSDNRMFDGGLVVATDPICGSQSVKDVPQAAGYCYD